MAEPVSIAPDEVAPPTEKTALPVAVVKSNDLRPAGSSVPPTWLRWGEPIFAILLALCVLLPGLGRFQLVDCWETHYSEVARRMLQEDDWVFLRWENESFRSKPALTFWLIAASFRSFGMAKDGAYSGEFMDMQTNFAARLPFALFAVMGLALMFVMLRRLVSRKMAWIGFLAMLATPFFALVARQAITDMPMVACVMGGVALFAMALHAGDRVYSPWGLSEQAQKIARGVFALCFAGIGIWLLTGNRDEICQLIAPQAAMPLRKILMLLFWAPWWLLFYPLRNLKQVSWHHLFIAGLFLLVGSQVALGIQHFANHQNVAGGVPRFMPFLLCLVFTWLFVGLIYTQLAWGKQHSVSRTYMGWFFILAGISVLAKGPPGVGLMGAICLVYILTAKMWGRRQWSSLVVTPLLCIKPFRRRLIASGRLTHSQSWLASVREELTTTWSVVPNLHIVSGIVVACMVALPWHIGMFLRDGMGWYNEYIGLHMLHRFADGAGVHGDKGTFDYLTSQLAPGMWMWAGLLPAAAACYMFSKDRLISAGKAHLGLICGIWAIVSMALFCFSEIKFHHYILPAVPPLALLVGFWLHDVWERQITRTAMACFIAMAVVLLVLLDLVFEPKQLIEMFVYRYDRPWPSGSPWWIDVSPGLQACAVFCLVSLLVLAFKWTQRLGVIMVLASALAMTLWISNSYMSAAAEHWGQRNLWEAYYRLRTIHGVDIKYKNLGDLAEAWKTSDGKLTVKSYIPDDFAKGAAMTVRIYTTGGLVPGDIVELAGTVDSVGDHDFVIAVPEAERQKLKVLIDKGSKTKPTGQRPWQQVNADRLLAWQLFWRGENFWANGEIFGQTEDTKTVFIESNNEKFLKYLNKPERKGQQFFVITEAGRAASLSGILPTKLAKETVHELKTVSNNKFAILRFAL